MKKIIALVLMFALVVSSFTGCKKKEDSADSKKTDEKTTEVSTSESSVAGMDGWKPFDEKVSITIPVYDRALEGFPAVDDNYWTKWVQKEFGDKWNIEVKYVAIPRNDVMTKYSMLIAADETPTILMEFDYPKVAQWANDGAMQTYNIDDFAQVAPTYYQAMKDNDLLKYTNIQDDTYFALAVRPYYNSTYSFATFVRKDWLNKVGKEIPKNYKEFTAALDAIVAAGLTDQPIGVGLPTAAYTANFGFRDFPVNEEDWVKYSSLSVADFTSNATYKMLKRQNFEYNKGYYASEYDLDADGSQAKTDFINGKTYQYSGYISQNVDWLNAFYQNNPDAELAISDIYTPVEEGVMDVPAYRTNNPFGMIIGFSSLASKDQLKAAWMYMEWMSQEDTLFTLENGIEGKTYKLDENNKPVIDPTYKGEEMLNTNSNGDITCVVHTSKNTGSIEETIKAISPQGLPQDFYQQLVDTYYAQQETSKYAYTDPLFSVPIDSESEYSATLLSLWKEYNVKLTKCNPSEFDGLYKELSKKYLDAGYQEIIDERLAAYKDGNCSLLPDSIKQ
jgi:putative aldouronate transport system substrate-binding protein